MKALGVLALGCSLALGASCEEEPRRLDVERSAVSAGEAVIVHFDAPKSSSSGEEIWLTLAKLGASDSPAARVLVPRGARSATVSTFEPGAFEVRLHASSFPGRPHHVVARARVDVAERMLARHPPPIWFW